MIPEIFLYAALAEPSTFVGKSKAFFNMFRSSPFGTRSRTLPIIAGGSDEPFDTRTSVAYYGKLQAELERRTNVIIHRFTVIATSLSRNEATTFDSDRMALVLNGYADRLRDINAKYKSLGVKPDRNEWNRTSRELDRNIIKIERFLNKNWDFIDSQAQHMINYRFFEGPNHLIKLLEYMRTMRKSAFPPTIAGGSDEDESVNQRVSGLRPIDIPGVVGWQTSDWTPAQYAYYKDIQQTIGKSLVPITVSLQMIARYAPRRLGILSNNYAYHLILIAEHYSVLVKRQRNMHPNAIKREWEIVRLDMEKTLMHMDRFVRRQAANIDAVHEGQPKFTEDHAFILRRIAITRRLNEAA
jgi:hypothetical protein